MKTEPVDSAPPANTRRSDVSPPTDPDGDASAPDGFLTRWSGWIVGAAAVVSSTVILHAARGTSFYFVDEWWFITRRRDASLDDFLRPHNSHLVAIPVAIYNALFRIVGMRTYVPYIAILVGLHVLTCVLLFVYLRRRAPVLYALVATIALLFLGHAWEDLLWAFQITYLLSAATGLTALLLLDRRDRLGDIGAAVAIAASIASGGIGLLFAGGALVELLWTRRDRHRVWIVGAPAALYALWYVSYGKSDASLDNFANIDPYTTTVAGTASRSLFGTSLLVGKLIVLVFLVVVVVQAARTWPIAARFANCIAMLIGFWLLLTYTRGSMFASTGTESRYVYPSVLFMLLVGAELLRTRQPSVRSPNRAMAIVGGIVLVALLAHGIADNLDALSDGGAVLRATAAGGKARYSALMLVQDEADRSLPMWFYPHIYRSGDVIDAINDLDYPVFTRAQLLRQPERERHGADDQLFSALGGSDASPRALSGAELAVSDAVGGTLTPDGACLTFRPDGPGAHLTLRGDQLGLRVEATGAAPVDVAVRSIADGFRAQPSFTVAPGASRDLLLLPNGMAPWAVRLHSSDPFRACAVG